MTKRHFESAAILVKAILDGHWTNDLPSWASEYSPYVETSTEADGNIPPDYVRAVWTAEVFIHLFYEWNPRFDEQRFLVACGLAVAPAKKGKVKA